MIRISTNLRSKVGRSVVDSIIFGKRADVFDPAKQFADFGLPVVDLSVDEKGRAAANAA